MNDLETRLRDDLARVAERTPAPDGLADRLLAGLDEPGRGTGGTRRWTTPLLAAAIAVIVLAGVLVGSRFLAQRPQPEAPVAPTVSTVPTPTSVPATRGTPIATGQVSTTVSRPDWVTRTVTAAGVPFGFTAVRAVFPTPQRGTVLGDASCSGVPDRCPALLRTTDGGRTFRTLPLPSGVTVRATGGCEGQAEPGCVSELLDAGDGAMVLWGRGAVFRTSDDGASWQSVDDRTGITGVAVVGGRLLIAAGETSDSSLVRIDDRGGAQPVTLPSPAPWGVFLVQAGSAAVAVANDVGVLRVARSTDGTRWSPLPVPARCSGQVSGLPDGSAVMMCLGEGETAALIARPGASSWRPVELPSRFAGGQLVNALVGLGADRLAFAVGDADQASADWTWLSTSDGGKSWQTAPDPDGRHRPLPGTTTGEPIASSTALAAPLELGRAVGISTDLGRSWTLIDLDG